MEIVSVQVLRGIAALAVVAYHISERFALGFKAGAFGVDLFFVVSGFVMWVTTSGKPISPAHFFKRRFYRVVPMYWIATIAVYALMLARPAFFPNHDLGFGHFVRSLAFLPAFQGADLKPTLEVGWTLYFEMFFYLLFALSLFVPQAFRLAVLVSDFFALVVLGLRLDGGLLATLTRPIILEFLAGIVVASLWTAGRRIGGPAAAALIVAGFAVLVLWGQDAHGLSWGVAATLLFTGALGLEDLARRLKGTVLELMGNASYSIYLWHTIFLVLVDGIVLRFTSNEGIRMVAVTILCIAGSIAVHRYLEKPLMHGLGRMSAVEPNRRPSADRM